MSWRWWRNDRKRVDPPIKIQATTKQQLRRVFDDLPTREEFRFLIDKEVNWILKLAKLHAAKAEVNVKLLPTKEAKEHIRRVLALARRLDAAMRAMPAEAWVVLSQQIGGIHPALLGSQLLALSRQGSTASKNKGGRPTSLSTGYAEIITAQAAVTYTMLTGKPATPGQNRLSGKPSEFQRFLAGIFLALGITASAELHAKRRRFRERTPTK